MSTIKISALPTANSIDGAANFIPIVQSGVTNKISRNVFLGITSSPLGSSDSQTISNKTIDNTNTITTLDSVFTIQNNGDTTKQVNFQLSGLTTGNTRTITIPDASLTMVGTTTTQTLTNKTLTAPTISGGTIDNATITVDSIAGHTTSTIVTVANLQISNGVLNSANAVTAVSVAPGGIQPQALVSGTGSGWSMQSYTPTFTNLTVGNGTLVGRYIQMGKIVFARGTLVFGSTTSVSGFIGMTFPLASLSSYDTSQAIGWASVDASTSYVMPIRWSSTTVCQILGSSLTQAATSSTVPLTWASTDVLSWDYWYEVP